LANIKSQIKRNKQNEKRRLRNRMFRGSARVAVRDARRSMDAGNQKESSSAVWAAIRALDKAAEKGVIHKNNAARRKGRLMKRLSAMGVQVEKSAMAKKAPAAEAEAPKKAAPKKATTKKASTTAKAKKTTKTAKKSAASKTAKKTTTTKATKKTTTKKTTKK
jgi:small subunit ribosomal protein S20